MAWPIEWYIINKRYHKNTTEFFIYTKEIGFNNLYKIKFHHICEKRIHSSDGVKIVYKDHYTGFICFIGVDECCYIGIEKEK